MGAVNQRIRKGDMKGVGNYKRASRECFPEPVIPIPVTLYGTEANEPKKTLARDHKSGRPIPG